MVSTISSTEKKRIGIQILLDSRKNSKERNRLGQFATPPELADQILLKAKTLLKGQKIQFLDPAFGTGSFYSSLLKHFGQEAVEKALGFEIDPHYGGAAKHLWKNQDILINIADFTTTFPPKTEAKKFNLLICNPPYVRHHHIPKERKIMLQRQVRVYSGAQTSQLIGLYGLFLLLSVSWMKREGIGCWLIPSEFLDVNYGRELKRFLLNKVQLLQVHRFDPNDIQFNDALVSSAVVIFKNLAPTKNTKATLSFGGNLLSPTKKHFLLMSQLDPEMKWNRKMFTAQKTCKASSSDLIRFGDLFRVKRGIATGSNDFFILNFDKAKELKISKKFLTPILPSPRHLKDIVVECDPKGLPTIINKQFLIDVDITLDKVKKACSSTHRYLQKGLKLGIADRYLCKNRKLWYSQEKREPAPIMVTYMGRSNKKSCNSTFRFILNKSNAIGANTYLLLYPTFHLQRLIEHKNNLVETLWRYMNENGDELFKSAGRVYGGGLYKLEPKELTDLALPIGRLLS